MHRGIAFTQLEVSNPSTDRITTISHQFNKVDSRLQMNLTHEGTVTIGIPDIFKVKGSYRVETVDQLDEIRKAIANNGSGKNSREAA